jgi:hypothetical protein
MRIHHVYGINARIIAVAVSLSLSTACANHLKSGPSADDARSFVEAANTQLDPLGARAARAEWVKSNSIPVALLHPVRNRLHDEP